MTKVVSRLKELFNLRFLVTFVTLMVGVAAFAQTTPTTLIEAADVQEIVTTILAYMGIVVAGAIALWAAAIGLKRGVQLLRRYL